MGAGETSKMVEKWCTVVIAGASLQFAFTAICGDFSIYNIVPCVPGEERVLAAEMAEYKSLTGEAVVLYSLPCAPEGKPASAKIDRHVESYRKFAAACREADPELKVGILIQSLLGHFVGDSVVKDRESLKSPTSSEASSRTGS